MHLLMLPKQTVFVCETYINPDPTAAQLVDMTFPWEGCVESPS
jgi:malate dehydrogenase (oxaloacetate-decarboxylating)(NADP+)